MENSFGKFYNILNESQQNSKSLNIVRSGLNMRKKDCGNFWDDFIYLCGNAEAMSELLDVPKEKITKWRYSINKVVDQVKDLDSNKKIKKKVFKTGDLKMKSIREWMMENDMGNMDDVQMRGLVSQARGGITINPTVKMKLKPALEKAFGDLADQNPMDIVKEVLAITMSLLSDTHRTTVTPETIKQMVRELENHKSEE